MADVERHRRRLAEQKLAIAEKLLAANGLAIPQACGQPLTMLDDYNGYNNMRHGFCYVRNVDLHRYLQGMMD